MREYLASLRDDMLIGKPFAEGEDKDLLLWHVLLHVVNHGNNHRAQILRLLSDLGVRTTSQDYIFYVAKLKEISEELFNLQFQHRTNQLDNKARLGLAKKDLARLKTVLREKTGQTW